jgi:hypothetical protein
MVRRIMSTTWLTSTGWLVSISSRGQPPATGSATFIVPDILQRADVVEVAGMTGPSSTHVSGPHDLLLAAAEDFDHLAGKSSKLVNGDGPVEVALDHSADRRLGSDREHGKDRASSDPPRCFDVRDREHRHSTGSSRVSRQPAPCVVDAVSLVGVERFCREAGEPIPPLVGDEHAGCVLAEPFAPVEVVVE